MPSATGSTVSDSTTPPPPNVLIGWLVFALVAEMSNTATIWATLPAGAGGGDRMFEAGPVLLTMLESGVVGVTTCGVVMVTTAGAPPKAFGEIAAVTCGGAGAPATGAVAGGGEVTVAAVAGGTDACVAG